MLRHFCLARLGAALAVIWAGACQSDWLLSTAAEPEDEGVGGSAPHHVAGASGLGGECADCDDCDSGACLPAPPRAEIAVAIAGACLRRETKLHCWGGIDHQPPLLGNPEGTGSSLPLQLAADIGWASVSTTAGPHFCGLSQAGTTYCWGGNGSGQLGLGDGEDRLEPTALPQVSFRAVVAGSGHTCALSAEGEAYCWGRNLDGELGLGHRDSAAAPKKVVGAPKLTSLSLGWGHTCGITPQNELYCWGRNLEGQLGLGDLESRTVPVRIPMAQGTRSFATGGHHTCVLDEAGDLYCFGENLDGQVSGGPEETISSPTLIELEEPVTRVSAGVYSTVFLGESGSLYVSGDLQAVSPAVRDASEPTSPARVETDVSFASVAVGYSFACGLTPDDRVYCWGQNGSGQLGLGDTENRDSPTEVALP